MNRVALGAAVFALLGSAVAAQAGQGRQHDARTCRVEVLYSEMLPVGPLFHHTIRARLLVTPADRPAYETTVEEVTSWQAPPLRQGQRLRLPCDSALIEPSFRLF